MCAISGLHSYCWTMASDDAKYPSLSRSGSHSPQPFLEIGLERKGLYRSTGAAIDNIPLEENEAHGEQPPASLFGISSSDDAISPSLSRSLSLFPQPNLMNSLGRIRLHRSRTAANINITVEENEANGKPRPASFFGNLNFGVKSAVVFLTIYLGIGCLCSYFVENQMKGVRTNRILDALYFCIVTTTTGGNGDLVPDSVASKLLGCVFGFSGMALIGLILSKSADFLIEKQDILLIKVMSIYKKVDEYEIMKKIQSNRVRDKFLLALGLVTGHIIVGTVVLYKVEKLSFFDSTITTLGYGDKSFSTKAGRAFAVIWILTSTICLGQFLFYLAELSTEKRQRDLVKWVLSRRMTVSDLLAADLDNNGFVNAAEFVVYKLKEMGKITQEDISVVMEEFGNLDVGQTGKLTLSDIMINME